MRLCAAVGELGRIEKLLLRQANRATHIAIAWVLDARQEAGNRLEEQIPVLRLQRPGTAENMRNLTVGQSDRRHAAGPRDGYSPAYAIWRT
jgi:hypothetical protein